MKRPLVTLTVIAIVVFALASVGPVLYKVFTDTGTKTSGLDADGAKPASTDINGTWQISSGTGSNTTSAGYTFHEILPGKSKETSGSTSHVTGSFVVENNTLVSGQATVDLSTLASDQEKRDINVRRTILETDTYPNAVFKVTKSANLSSLPSDGKPGDVNVDGEFTIHGVTRPATVTLKILRTGSNIIISSTIPINRLDYGIKSPEFVAAQIDKTGEINLLLALNKT